MCGGLKIRGAAFPASFGNTSSAGLLFFLVPGGHETFRSLQHPLVPRHPIVHLRCKSPFSLALGVLTCGEGGSQVHPLVKELVIERGEHTSEINKESQYLAGVTEIALLLRRLPFVLQ